MNIKVFCVFLGSDRGYSTCDDIFLTVFVCSLRVLGCFGSSIWQAGSWRFPLFGGFILVNNFIFFSSSLVVIHSATLVPSFYMFFFVTRSSTFLHLSIAIEF